MFLHLEDPGYGGQQGTGQHHVKGLGRQQDLPQVLGGAVGQRVRGQPLAGCSGPASATGGPLRPRGELVADVLGDGLGVGDGQEAVLLVGALQDLGCRLLGGETGQIAPTITLLHNANTAQTAVLFWFVFFWDDAKVWLKKVQKIRTVLSLTG